MTEKLSRGAIVTKRVLHGVLAVLLLVPPLVWFGARNRLLPEALTTGVGGTGVVTIGAVLAPRGLLLIGLDIIGTKVTEINVTSPTGFREILDQTGCDVPALYVDAVERAVAR